MEQWEWAEHDRRYAAGFDARGTTGIAVWLPRELNKAEGIQAAMTRGHRLTVIVSSAVRNWLQAHGAPDVWVSVALQQAPGTANDNIREASAAFDAQRRGPAATWTKSPNDGVCVARWGVEFQGGDRDVVNTLALVVESAIADTGARFRAGEALAR